MNDAVKTILLVITQPDEALVAGLISQHQREEKRKLTVIDLTAPAPDYEKLLEEIFAADTVCVW